MNSNRRRLRALSLLLAVLVALLSFADARRSGGGFGGSRGFRSSPLRRTPSFRAPSRTPSLRAPTAGGGVLGRTYRPRNTFFFVPFFGFHPFGFFGAPFFGGSGGAGWGVLGLLFNVAGLIAVIAFVAWLVRRFRGF